MRKRHVSLKLGDTGEHFQKDLLGEVFLGNTTRQARTHDADDHGVKMFNEFTRSPLISLANTRKTTGKVERLIVKGHKGNGKVAFTISKTQMSLRGYNAFLDFISSPRRVFSLDAKHHSVASTYLDARSERAACSAGRASVVKSRACYRLRRSRGFNCVNHPV